MPRFVFSADGHVVEPPALFLERMPPSLREHGIRLERRDDEILLLAGTRPIHRTRLDRPPPKDRQDFSRGSLPGARDLAARALDMEREGIDAEIVFPSMGLWTYLVENPEAELATTQIYNDWHHGFFSGHLETFVRCGILPVRRLADTLAELERLAALGFTAAMLPSLVPAGVPRYNDEAWDPVFAAGQRLGVVFVLHTGTGREDVRAEKGPGGAIINYTIQMCDAQQSLMYLVAGGVLDRFPGARVAVIESGASWLAALAERMDEVNQAHHMFVRPKLSLPPREIIERQVSASFQVDRACILSRHVTGHRALMWGADYPHHEGTYPRSREVVDHLFDGIEISEQERADILGGNAARLFRLPRAEENHG
jgi:predicted TIM-barrel fold metal-dependent hydrolase